MSVPNTNRKSIPRFRYPSLRSNPPTTRNCLNHPKTKARTSQPLARALLRPKQRLLSKNPATSFNCLLNSGFVPALDGWTNQPFPGYTHRPIQAGMKIIVLLIGKVFQNHYHKASSAYVYQTFPLDNRRLCGTIPTFSPTEYSLGNVFASHRH